MCRKSTLLHCGYSNAQVVEVSCLLAEEATGVMVKEGSSVLNMSARAQTRNNVSGKQICQLIRGASCEVG